jgi:hypothetical protein
MIRNSKKAQAQIVNQKDETHISLAGDIDEDAEFFSIEPTKLLVIDMKKLRFINSCGLRSWVNWMRQIPPATNVTFKNCPKVIVDQMNILKGFLPPGVIIESFYVPYYCDPCGIETNVLATRGEHFKERFENQEAYTKFPEFISCPNCGSNAELGVIANRYFSFIKVS